MAKISFGGLLKNPLVLGVLGTEVAGNLSASYMNAEKEKQAEEQFQAQKAQTIGEATGVAPTTTPTTGIKGLFSKIGLASPTQPLTPYEAAAGQVGVTQGNALKMKAIMDAIAKRPIVGPGEGWKSFSDEFTARTGLPLPDLAAPTPKELKESQGGKINLYSKDGKQQDMVVPYRAGTIFTAPAGMALSKRTATVMTPDEKVDLARREAAARGLGAQDAYYAGDAAMPIHNTVMLDADLNPIPHGVTREQAARNGGASYGPKEMQSIQDAKDLDQQIDNLIVVAKARLVDTKGMDPTSASAAIIANQLLIGKDAGVKLPFTNIQLLKGTSKDAYNLKYGMQFLSIPIARLMTQQRLNQKEIDTVNGYLGGLDGKSQEIALDNLQKAKEFIDGRLKTRIKAGADNTAAKIGYDASNSYWGETTEAPAPVDTNPDQPPDEPETTEAPDNPMDMTGSDITPTP